MIASVLSLRRGGVETRPYLIEPYSQEGVSSSSTTLSGQAATIVARVYRVHFPR